MIISSVVVVTIITLAALGVVAAIILFLASKRFMVIEDPRIDQVEEILPATNCGGCGLPGCRAFAEALVKADDISSMNCPVGGASTMSKISQLLGKQAGDSKPKVAVVRCSGARSHRPQTSQYQGAASCAVASALFCGETGCSHGCLGLGDCVVSCKFDAMYMDKVTDLPVINENNCIACGACVTACPKKIIEMRLKGPKGRRIFVSCINKDKGAVARKACSVACIGCSKCQKVCPHDAIVIENNLAYINYEKCKLCRKCTSECPTGAILEINFPARQQKAEKEETGAVAVE